MQQKLSLRAFTLIELLVGISILGIIALGVTQMDFSRLSKNQQVNIEIVKILNIFEEIRNNALIGRGVGVTLDLPQAWRVQISESSGGQINTHHTLNGSSWVSYPNGNWSAVSPYTLSNITCSNLDNSTTASLSGVGTFTFNGSNIHFTGTNCNDNTLKQISFDYGLGNLSGTIHINTLSGVIEVR